jgi:hypothetical protein
MRDRTAPRICARPPERFRSRLAAAGEVEAVHPLDFFRQPEPQHRHREKHVPLAIGSTGHVEAFGGLMPVFVPMIHWIVLPVICIARQERRNNIVVSQLSRIYRKGNVLWLAKPERRRPAPGHGRRGGTAVGNGGTPGRK